MFEIEKEQSAKTSAESWYTDNDQITGAEEIEEEDNMHKVANDNNNNCNNVDDDDDKTSVLTSARHYSEPMKKPKCVTQHQLFFISLLLDSHGST